MPRDEVMSANKKLLHELNNSESSLHYSLNPQSGDKTMQIRLTIQISSEIMNGSLPENAIP